MKTLKWFFKRKQITRDGTVKRLSSAYMKKARKNLVTMELLSKATKHKKALQLPEDYDSFEWVVVTAYYAMYLAALSLLARTGYKSSNHTATILALEEFIVKEKLLEKEYLERIKEIKLQAKEIETLKRTRDRREIAQYSVTKQTSKELAQKSRTNAHEFVNRIEELLETIE